MSRQKFWFVAGDQATSVIAHNVHDAWLSIEIRNKRGEIPNEFRTMLVEAYEADTGKMIARRMWADWHSALMADTYGEDWKEKMEEVRKGS